MPKDRVSERIRQIREEAQILGEEDKVLTEKVKEQSRVAQQRADAASARLRRLKRAAGSDSRSRHTR
jgi:SMC interacting uncharacterized protein involved in chromosome segregation